MSRADQAPHILRLGQYAYDHEYDFSWNQSEDWAAALLKGLEQNCDIEDPSYREGEIEIQFKVKRVDGAPFGDSLLVHGQFKGQFLVPCVRCLTLTQQEFDAEVYGIYVDESFEDKPEYEEATTVYLEGHERELYFHEKGHADLFDMVKENVIVNIDPFPLHVENCKGLCSTCGTNLNDSTCKHHP